MYLLEVPSGAADTPNKMARNNENTIENFFDEWNFERLTVKIAMI